MIAADVDLGGYEDALYVYRDVPAEVSHVSAYEWRPGSRPVPLAASVVRQGDETTIGVATAPLVIISLERGDGSYILDGPLDARDTAVARRLDGVWRRTVTGAAAPQADAGPAIDWLSETGVSGDRWPVCWWSGPQRWECRGVPLGVSGIAVALNGSGVLSAPVTAAATPFLRTSAWARLLMVRDRDGVPSKLRVTGGRAVGSRSQRVPGVRLETAALPDVRAVTIAPGIVWLAGDGSPPDAWIEIRAARSGPAYVPIADIADGSALTPVSLLLDDSRTVVATVVSSRGEPAPGTLWTMFRLIDPVEASRREGVPPPRRVQTREATADAEGTFQVDGLGDAMYEIVAWHPQLGRGSVLVPDGSSRVTIRLQSPGLARGRIVSDGKPVPGVDIISVPDPTAYAAAADPIDLKGGDARTEADGRFSVPLATGGGGELRVGGGVYPIKRVPLPRAPLPIVELGDIDLGKAVTMTVVLDQDPGCDIRAVGPIGRTGLQIVTASRTGPGLFSITLPEEGSWEFGLLCGREERSVAPSVVKVGAEGPKEVRLMVR